MAHRKHGRRWAATSALFAVLALASAAIAHADPPPSPYPDAVHVQGTYDRAVPEDYLVPGQVGVWFLSPTGLNCAIFDKGGFGCRGDITGAPPGTDTIAWHNGDILVKYDLWASVRFPQGRAQRPLPPRTLLSYEGTDCAVLPDTSTYCTRGAFRFLVAARETWLNG